ncbi:tetracenomycin polyketide synthesis O-methyltransferase tcmP [Cadophora sp. MPI-SDFR-AT-0126]|nr:tetracenomycin polyketide synthesis O-methyltransferase tcmP [Leotiomycetes sp. MPI-SDFR-AT-0126]
MALDAASSPPTKIEAKTNKITLTGPQETLLATLYGRSRDAANSNPILGDEWALQLVEKVDYDFAKTGIDATASASIAIRAKLLDQWTSEFLAAHSSATVLHLACGVDSRCLRVQRGPGVRWVDVDLPDVIDLRQQLVPTPEGDYRLLSASVIDADQWLDSIPADRPTIVVFEGLTMYLHEDEGRRMVETIVNRFASTGGQLVFDCYGSIAIRLQRFMRPVKNTGSELHWGIDNPKALEAWCSGLKLVDDLRSVDMPGISQLPLAAQAQAWVVSNIPYLRNAGRVLRYKF